MIVGDKFYYRSKYGGVGVIGEVAEVGFYISKMKTCDLRCEFIFSTEGVKYEMDEIRLVDKVLTDEEIKERAGFIKAIINHSPKLAHLREKL